VGSVAGPALSGAAKVAGEGAGVVGQGLGQASKAVGGATSAVTGAVGGATSAVTGAVGGATSAVNSTVTSTVQSIEAALPPEFQDVVAKAQTDSDTAVALIGLAAALPIGLVVLGAATRGYAGDKNPFVVEEQLKKNRKAFIIDTRSEDARRNDGVPDLRGKARGKGASVEVVTLPPDERRVLSNPRAVELELAATKVKALTKNGARVYVLGPDAKDLAKAITGLGGRRAFVVAGGFDAWRSSGLKVGSKYAKNALEGLGEDTSEAASSFTQKVAGSVKTSITSKKPTDALVPFVGLVAVVAAVVNYKTALEYAGVIGIELTILAKLLSYESPWAFFEDVKDVAGGFAGAVGSFEPPSVPEVSVPKVSMPKVAEMAPPPPAPVKEEAVVEEAVVEEAVVEEAVEEEEVAEPEPEAAAPAPAEEKKAGRVYDESYADSKADMAKVAEEAERLADANDQGKRDM
jgi:rhodanese-related sulfurtransferase